MCQPLLLLQTALAAEPHCCSESRRGSSSPVLLQGCCSSPLLFTFPVICSAQTSLHTKASRKIPAIDQISRHGPHIRDEDAEQPNLSVFHSPAPQLQVFYQTLHCPWIAIACRNNCPLTAQSLIYLSKQLRSSCFKLNIWLKEVNSTNIAKSYKKAGEEPFTRACSERTTSNGFKVKESRFILDVRKKFFTMRVVVI